MTGRVEITNDIYHEVVVERFGEQVHIHQRDDTVVMSVRALYPLIQALLDKANLPTTHEHDTIRVQAQQRLRNVRLDDETEAETGIPASQVNPAISARERRVFIRLMLELTRDPYSATAANLRGLVLDMDGYDPQGLGSPRTAGD